MRPVKQKRYVIQHRGHLYQFDETNTAYMTDLVKARDKATELVDSQGGQAILFESVGSVESSEMEWTYHEGVAA